MQQLCAHNFPPNSVPFVPISSRWIRMAILPFRYPTVSVNRTSQRKDSRPHSWRGQRSLWPKRHSPSSRIESAQVFSSQPFPWHRPSFLVPNYSYYSGQTQARYSPLGSIGKTRTRPITANSPQRERGPLDTGAWNCHASLESCGLRLLRSLPVKKSA